ncbi:MAG TPA: sigma 54-interacting transcriptional regulator [Methylomirabilota bacterium]
MLDTFPDGLCLLTPTGIVLKSNQIAARFFGLDPHELTGRPLDAVAALPSVGPGFIPEVVASGAVASMVAELHEGRRVLMSARPIFSRSGEPLHVVLVLRDVSSMSRLVARVHETAPTQANAWSDMRHGVGSEFGASWVAASGVMKAVYARAVECAETNSPVLVLGETGTGKNLIARLIHARSKRNAGPFHEVNCGAFPETLIEAELFGYTRGAFTGADTRGKPGMLGVAHGGTLVLDEIAELPVALQVKLLRFLDVGEIWPIGASRARQLDVRIIAATNTNLNCAMDAGRFRSDLFYRLNVLTIHMPPLREHPEDLPALVDMMVATLEHRLGRRRRFSPEALTALAAYSFPGNVRELWNIVERVVITTKRPVVEADDLPPEITEAVGASLRAEPIGKSLKEVLRRVEASLVRDALARYGTQSRAAKHLGVGQATIARKAKEYRLGD